MPISQRPRRKNPAAGPWPKPRWRAAFMDYVVIAWGLTTIIAWIVAK